MPPQCHNLYETNTNSTMVLGIPMLSRTCPVVVQLYEPPCS